MNLLFVLQWIILDLLRKYMPGDLFNIDFDGREEKTKLIQQKAFIHQEQGTERKWGRAQWRRTYVRFELFKSMYTHCLSYMKIVVSFIFMLWRSILCPSIYGGLRYLTIYVLFIFRLFPTYECYGMWWNDMARRRNSTSAEEVARFPHLFPKPSWLISGKTSGHQKLVPTFPCMDWLP